MLGSNLSRGLLSRARDSRTGGSSISRISRSTKSIDKGWMKMKVLLYVAVQKDCIAGLAVMTVDSLNDCKLEREQSV